MPEPAPKPRIIVTTDPELDDLNSMLRLVLYSNEIEIAGLVYSSSQFHHAGDPARGIDPHRWPPADAVGHIDQAVEAYALAYSNLVVHDPRYPDPDALRALIRIGNIADVGDTAEPTPGSDLIKGVLLDDAPGQVFVQAWGGLNTIARALMSIEEEHAGTDAWDEIRARVTARTVLTSFGQQDSTFEQYIRPRWPELELREVATMAWGYFAWHVIDPADEVYLTADWMRENVSSVGPIGAAYRVWGDGLQMAEGFDHEDYFGIPEPTVEGLEAQGYKVWAPLRPQGSWISEGDTSNFALHIDNGLRCWEDPRRSGWGGRQVPHVSDPHQWVSVHSGGFTPGAPLEDWGEAGRWLGAFQRDLAARLRWSVTADFAGANHAPVIDVPGGFERSARPGEDVAVAFAVSDPDGDPVDVSAWIDAPASTVDDARVAVEGAVARVTVPSAAAPGEVLEAVLEARDHGAPSLTSYARVRISVTG